jgi:quercetin dioxygenase-like cupin family protein
VHYFRRPATWTVLLVAAVAVLAIVLPTAFGASAAAPSPVRNGLAESRHVVGAPGRTMVLSEVTVPPGVKLALHHHQGTQISRVAAGTLTYTVRRGQAEVFEGESEDQKLVRTVAAGQTARVKAGQWLVEQPSDDHEAANRGSAPVVIYLSTLLKTGAPPSSPVTLP